MSVEEMDTIQASSCENNVKQVLESNECEPKHFRNSFHSDRILEGLQSLRKNEVLCDIRFKTDDGSIVFGHKNVLMVASPYFEAMFNNFDGINKDLVSIRELDSTILQILLDYIYTGELIMTNENVQVLLPAANILQLDFVKAACAEFLQKQLDASNCLGIRAFADLHNCTELLSSSEAFIKKEFLEMVKSDEFLSLSFEDVVKIISCNDLAVPYEEKVFESVIKWVKQDLDQRKDFLTELMEHVRLPMIASRPDIFINIVNESLLKNNPKCNEYVIEAFHFNLQKSVQHFTIPQTIRCTPRQFGDSRKVILMFNRSDTSPKCYTEWYDPATKLREKAPGINDCRQLAGLGVIRDQFVFVVGGVNNLCSQSVSMLDVSLRSPSWVPMANMVVKRQRLGVAVLNDCIYAVGGGNLDNPLNCVEVFDVSIQKWRLVASMSTERRDFGVGVLNNHLYAVGGAAGKNRCLKSVEYYDPTLDTWTPVAEMSVCRQGVGVGVLDGVLYAIGGYNGKDLKSVEIYRPSDGVWSSVADMEICRFRPGVAVLDGLLYVIGGESAVGSMNDNIEIYNPKTNTWTMERYSRSESQIICKIGPNLVSIRELDSTILQILLDYIYTGELIMTNENVQVLLPAANILQLDFVKAACAEFLQKQLDASNCLGIRAFADLHNCTKLLSSSEALIKKEFLEVVKSDEFLSLSFEDVVKIISCNDLAVPYEEKVFESVIKWVKQDLDQRKDFLTELMEHVRLPMIASRPDIFINIVNEPLLKNNPKCNEYVIEAFHFNLQKSVQHFTIPQTIRCTPRQFGDSRKVILMFNRSDTSPKCYTEWYDPATKLREKAPGINDCRQLAGLGVNRDQFVFAVGDVNNLCSQSVSMLDVSLRSPSWVPMANMVVKRQRLGVAVLNDCIYAVGGGDVKNALNSVEVFDVSIQKWRLVASMSTGRCDFGVGVLNNLLYAVGGADNVCLKSVEYYDPTLDTWTPVAEMSVGRQGVGVGVLDGVLYAIGGYAEIHLKSVEIYRPSDGVWSSVADMEICRFCPGVAVLDGLLYVIGGESAFGSMNDNIEIYNPKTNTWTMERYSRSGCHIFGGLVVDRPPNFIN
ncbi:kelch-like protein 2 [Metopolophium dirhodum]|uniref:kelch-like protein 2 n=1 Tax=Metopolophium dirhodum TaxID=44670 RepID=UPI002990241E|nr:kelch-like protein 2 [Metopolophium dirhodum]